MEVPGHSAIGVTMNTCSARTPPMRSTRASGPELRPLATVLATVKASPGMEEACDLARSEGLEPPTF